MTKEELEANLRVGKWAREKIEEAVAEAVDADSPLAQPLREYLVNEHLTLNPNHFLQDNTRTVAATFCDGYMARATWLGQNEQAAD